MPTTDPLHADIHLTTRDELDQPGSVRALCGAWIYNRAYLSTKINDVSVSCADCKKAALS